MHETMRSGQDLELEVWVHVILWNSLASALVMSLVSILLMGVVTSVWPAGQGCRAQHLSCLPVGASHRLKVGAHWRPDSPKRPARSLPFLVLFLLLVQQPLGTRSPSVSGVRAARPWKQRHCK